MVQVAAAHPCLLGSGICRSLLWRHVLVIRNVSLHENRRQSLSHPVGSTPLDYPDRFLSVLGPHRDVSHHLWMRRRRTTASAQSTEFRARGKEDLCVRTTELSFLHVHAGYFVQRKSVGESELPVADCVLADPEVSSMLAKRFVAATVVTLDGEPDLHGVRRTARWPTSIHQDCLTGRRSLPSQSPVSQLMGAGHNGEGPLEVRSTVVLEPSPRLRFGRRGPIPSRTGSPGALGRGLIVELSRHRD